MSFNVIRKVDTLYFLNMFVYTRQNLKSLAAHQKELQDPPLEIH
jgi:hypothetical protein